MFFSGQFIVYLKLSAIRQRYNEYIVLKKNYPVPSVVYMDSLL